MSHIISNREIHIGSIARQERIENVLTTQSHSAQVMAGVLAEAWVQGDHGLVRDQICSAGTRELKTAWMNGTRAALHGDKMKDAFDTYMRGY